MKEERITQIYDYLNSSSDKEWIDPYYEHVSFDLLVMIVDYIENQQENEITINNALIKLLDFCEKNKDRSGYEIYKEIVFKNKLSKRKTTSFIALTSLALKYVSENGMNDGYTVTQLKNNKKELASLAFGTFEKLYKCAIRKEI